MSRKTVYVLFAALALAMSGPRAAFGEASEAAPSRKLEYFPLVPEVKWGELNWLQKTTASVAIVPGCVLSALANAYVWCANGLSD